MGTQRNQPIALWAAGDTVAGFAVVNRREARADKNGREFVDLDLADSSGQVNAKLWPDLAAATGAIDVYRFVFFEGQVQSFKDQLQLVLRKIRPATEADRGQGFDESKLVPSTAEDIDDLWRRLRQVLESLTTPALRALVDQALQVHGRALATHPAAKSVHHAYRGGLLEHVTKMAEVAHDLCAFYPEVDRDVVLTGVLFHDLGKIAELGAMPANDYTLVGRMIGHVVLGRDLLREAAAAVPNFPAPLLLHLEHLVLSHQGRREYGAPVEPMTAEALVLHAIDDLDAKLAQLRRARTTGQGLQFLRPLGRYVLLDAPGRDRAFPASPTNAENAAPEQPEPTAPTL